MGETPEPVKASLRLDCPVERAFETFTRDIGLWWPLAYTFAGDQLDAVEITGPDGEWLERNLDGRETSWGAVLEWQPPHSFAAEFAVSPERTPEPPGRRSEVRVRFASDGAGSRVDLEHYGFERHGENGATMREGMASPQGWPLILAEFARETRRA